VIGVGVRFLFPTLIDSSVGSGIRLITGHFLGVTFLGFYDLTDRMIQFPFQNIIVIGQAVALPAFCRLQENFEIVGTWFLKLIRFSTFLMAPISLALLLTAEMLIPLVYGEQWLPTVQLVKLLAPLIFLKPLAYSLPVYVSSGRPDLLRNLILVRFGITIPAVLIAAQFSLLAVCAVELGVMLVLAPLNLHYVSKMLSIPVSKILSEIGKSAKPLLVFGASLLVSRVLTVEWFHLRMEFSAAIIMISSGLTFLVGTRLFQPQVYSEAQSMLLSSIGLNRNPAGAE